MFLSLIMNQENVVQDQEETTVRTTKNEEENLQTCSDESCKSKGNKDDDSHKEQSGEAINSMETPSSQENITAELSSDLKLTKEQITAGTIKDEKENFQARSDQFCKPEANRAAPEWQKRPFLNVLQRMIAEETFTGNRSMRGSPVTSRRSICKYLIKTHRKEQSGDTVNNMETPSTQENITAELPSDLKLTKEQNSAGTIKDGEENFQARSDQFCKPEANRDDDSHKGQPGDIVNNTETPPPPEEVTVELPSDLKEKERSTQENMDNAVAIVGIAAITPGAENIRDFWRLLKNGENHITDVPASRWHIDAFYDSDPLKPGTAYVRKAGFVKDAEKFDNTFFEISEYEAASMDPQQSLLLECTYRALENGGITHISDTNTGVFIGAMTSDHASFYPAGSTEVDSYTATGVSSSMLAARVSYVNNLLGPSMVIDTACSSSLVAIHQGIQAIKNGDCDMAICGGVNYIGAPTMFVQLSKAEMLSPTGQSRAFSADADGYVRGEGCGIVVLKRLKDALDNNDRIWATVVSGVNQDGHTVTPVTAPSGTQQEKLMTDIYTKYDVDVSRLDYIEAHGTGTRAGDPVEVNSLGHFLKTMSEPRTRYIGSVKTNIGHLEAAAGVIGVIKVLLMMKHDTIVPSLHCQDVSKDIDLQNFQLEVPQTCLPWKGEDKMACCNSFGFGGTNSHVVLRMECQPNIASSQTLSLNVVCFSGKTKQSLIGSMETIRESLGKGGAVNDGQNDERLLMNIAYTSSVRRDHYSFRKAFVVDGIKEFHDSVSRSLAEDPPASPTRSRHLVFIFCGMGTAWPGMCKQMMRRFPVFKETMQKIDLILSEINENSWSLVDRLCNEYTTDDPVFSPVAVFACQVALVALWKSLGVNPDCVVGQSIGEVAAAYTAGCLSLEVAIKIIYLRSMFLAQVSGGKMMVVKNIRVENVREILREFDKASIAVKCSPVSCAVSSDSETMVRIEERFTPFKYSQKRVELIPLEVSVAYHSQFVQSCQEPLARALDKLEATPPKTSYISAVTGKKMTSAPGQGYWVRHLKEPVLFHKAVQVARDESPTNTVFLEIGPKSVLRAHMADIFPTKDLPVIESMHKPQEDKVFLLAIASVYELGVELAWAALYKGCHVTIVDEPRYAFDRRISLKRTAAQGFVVSGTEQVNQHLFVFQMSSKDSFKIFLSTLTTSFVYDHLVSNQILVPGALYLEAGLAIANRLRYDHSCLVVLSATFLTPVSLKKDEFIELEVRSDKKLKPGDQQQSRLTVSKQELDIAVIHIEWRPVLLAGQRTINIQYIREKCTFSTKKSDIYFSLKRLGFEYGQTFCLLENAYRGEGECLAEIKVISEVAKNFFSTTIHPCVLDAMFQSVVIMNDTHSTGDLQFLPESVKGLKVFSAMETVMYVYSRFLRGENKRATYNLTLLSSNGLVLATVDEFTLIRINVESHSGLPMLVSMDWVCACKKWDENTRISANAFVLDLRASSEGNDVNNVRYQSQTMEWEDIYQEVTTRMQEATHAPAIVIVCDTKVSEDTACDEVQTQVLNNCGVVHSVLRLVRDLNFDIPVYICTFGAWPAIEPSEQMPISPGATSVWGLTRAAQDENVYPRLATVDLHIPENLASSEFLSRMSQRLSSSRELLDNPEFLITAEAVYVNRVRRVDKRTSVPLFREAPLDPSEDYLILTEDEEGATKPFSIKDFTVVNCNSRNDIIRPFLFALPSPYLIKTPIVHKQSVGGSENYSVFALETVGQSTEHGVIVSCSVVQTGSRVSVPPDTTIPISLVPKYRLGDVTKFVLLFSLSEKVSSTEVTILTPAAHVGLARVLKMKLETDDTTRIVTVEEYQNLKSLTIQSETVVSLILLDRGVVSTLVQRWRGGTRLVTFTALITPEALTYLAFECPEVQIKLVDTQMLFRPLKLAQIVSDVKTWLSRLDEGLLSNISQHMHSLERADEASSNFYVDRLSSMLAFTELMPRDICAKVDSDNIFNVRSVYIVVGGLTGLGWICVKFLARHGARNIAIIQRRTPSAEHTSNIEELTKHFDCIIHVFQADVTKHNEVKQSLSSVGEKFNNAPLKGIFFGAAVVDDGGFFSMSRNKFDIVLAPKIKGAWNVHLLTRHLPLDFFVMHSSAASVFGNQGEANYAAGNAFLDGLAFYRRNQGLCAQSFGWGPLSTGLLDNNETAQRKLESLGFLHMTEAEIEDSLSPLLMLNWTHCAPVKMDEERYFTRLQASGLQPLLQRFQSLGLQRVAKATFDKIDVLAVARTKDPAARLELYHSYVLQIIRRVFSVDQSQVTLDTNLTDLGMDSVSSSMILGQIYRDTSIKLNAVTLISGGATVRSIAQNLNDNFSS